MKKGEMMKGEGMRNGEGKWKGEGMKGEGMMKGGG